MPRALTCAVAIVALSVATSAMAADYPGYPEMRPAYPSDWDNGPDNPMKFEFGLRYWYSKGEQSAEYAGETARAKDTSHIIEGHLRIEDHYTNSYLKGQAGFAMAIDGAYSTSVSNSTLAFEGGQVGHAGVDFGIMPWGNESAHFGGFIGYQYNRESPDAARANLLGLDAFNINALRLGLSTKAELSNYFDISAEIAAIPYAHVSGVTPEFVIPTTNVGGINVNRAAGALSGRGYGASAELMLGVHPTENLVIRFGGRGWFVQGPATAQLTGYNNADPSTTTTIGAVLDNTIFSRYGALVELTGRF